MANLISLCCVAVSVAHHVPVHGIGSAGQFHLLCVCVLCADLISVVL